jgi:hypothetical protein
MNTEELRHVMRVVKFELRVQAAIRVCVAGGTR